MCLQSERNMLSDLCSPDLKEVRFVKSGSSVQSFLL